MKTTFIILLLLALTLNIGCGEDENLSANGLHKVTYRAMLVSSVVYTDPTNNKKVTKQLSTIGFTESFENIEGGKTLYVAGYDYSLSTDPKVSIEVDGKIVGEDEDKQNSYKAEVSYFLP